MLLFLFELIASTVVCSPEILESLPVSLVITTEIEINVNTRPGEH